MLFLKESTFSAQSFIVQQQKWTIMYKYCDGQFNVPRTGRRDTKLRWSNFHFLLENWNGTHCRFFFFLTPSRRIAQNLENQKVSFTSYREKNKQKWKGQILFNINFNSNHLSLIISDNCLSFRDPPSAAYKDFIIHNIKQDVTSYICYDHTKDATDKL